ncbi:hypothetical protein J2R78_008998 [Bradyrhizobium sp. USDA 4538]|uniref:hypothetical protein n=1 Tax=unclassified Bradyrhizobium TaxID=2631580 RepID=UPI00209DB224|nr:MULTISPECIES: hypothetical protein [unclassified Bradyrhizobium]MCP1845964.1 hypothetical protein [Bradyrhizobium sp. USDA 4538]MCP1907402.1 hypothetical protein [Bradyrhizobium sp. USDA 4537]MCP1985188.1 hypothetical protein [Bradyrhizobium sp. USDA 4539]
MAGIMAAIEDGLYQPSMKARMDELERQRAEITERLTQAPADIPDVHPNVANIYRKNVVRFTEALDDPDGGREAAQALRSLIGEIVLPPGEKRGEVHAELRGELMGILDFANVTGNQRAGRFMSAAAACPRLLKNKYRARSAPLSIKDTSAVILDHRSAYFEFEHFLLQATRLGAACRRTSVTSMTNGPPSQLTTMPPYSLVQTFLKRSVCREDAAARCRLADGRQRKRVKVSCGGTAAMSRDLVCCGDETQTVQQRPLSLEISAAVTDQR